jgi:colanic acid/amylovoran biosynthesis glycosyltransferase
MTRLALVVQRFPRLSETFISSKFLGLLDAGWDVHLVCQAFDAGLWETLPQLATHPTARARVHVVAPHGQPLEAAVRWLPQSVVTAARAPRATRRYWTGGRGSGKTLLKQSYLDAPLIALQPDILHFEFGSLAVGRTYLKERLGCKLTASFRGYDLNYVGLESADTFDAVWREADAIHLLGEDLWRRAQRRGCPPTMPHVLIPPAIDTAFFAPPARRDEPDGRPLRLLSVGRLEWKKGYEYTLAAAALLRARGLRFEYRIAGAGNYLEALAFARHELGLEDAVTFLGALSREAVREQMAWADVFVHGAVSEGFCNAVLEAQAMELPVVTSDADGLSENVSDGLTGYVVPRRDPAALAARIITLAADARARSEMGAAGRARVEASFQLRDQIAAFDRFYREVAR